MVLGCVLSENNYLHPRHQAESFSISYQVIINNIQGQCYLEYISFKLNRVTQSVIPLPKFKDNLKTHARYFGGYRLAQKHTIKVKGVERVENQCVIHQCKSNP